MDHGADVNFKNSFGDDALEILLEYGLGVTSYKVLDILLKAGFNFKNKHVKKVQQYFFIQKSEILKIMVLDKLLIG